MPITSNDGGVLKTLNVITANDSGVLHELNTVHENEDGVLREIFSAKKGASVSGITPLVVAEDHIVIVNSGTFTLTAPAGTRIIVASGGYGALGGYVAEYTLTEPIINAQCTATVAAADVREKDASKLAVGSTVYGCGETVQIIQSKWGPIGGDGGKGNRLEYESGKGYVAKSGLYPTGAGGGSGGAYYSPDTNVGSSPGGNSYGYGNKGASGGYFSTSSNTETMKGKTSICGSEGGDYGTTSPRGGYGYGGGAGGYAAGGGLGGYCYQSPSSGRGTSGQSGMGIIVIEW